MTTQVEETLLYEGKKWRMSSLPLDDYFLLQKKASPFQAASSACWRGYVGEWSIEDGRLYLDALRRPHTERDMISLASLFAGHHARRPLVQWYTGPLLLTDQINPEDFRGAEHMERPALVLEILRGKLVQERVVDAPELDTPY